MENLHGTWFEVKVRCFDGKSKRQPRLEYAVDAMTWSEAEARSLQGIREDYEDFILEDIKKSQYQTIILDSEESVGTDDECSFYKVKVNFQDLSTSGKLKKVPQTFLVEAETIKDAPVILADYLREIGNALPYEQVSVQRTKIYNIIKREE